MTQAVKRACDACHRRKVKCDGINPCRNCASAQLSCTYNAIPQKKGPKGSRAKVISELRETQRQTSLSAKVQSRMSGLPSPPSSPSQAPTPGLLTPEVVKECIEFFFNNMYGSIPILNRRQLEQQAMYMEQNRDSYCLLTSLCAFMMLQPGMSMPAGDPYNLDMMPGANIVSSNLLLEETLRVRKGYEYIDSPSLNTLCTNFFIFGCYYGMELHDKAWYYLREATTMIHMMGMQKEENYMQWDNVEASRRRRLFWLYFVTERAYAIHRGRPLTLQSTINLPSVSDDPTDPLAHQLNNFIVLLTSYRHFDDSLISSWTKLKSSMSTSFVNAMQKQLNEILPQYLIQDSQATDVNTNQQWMKQLAWQLSAASMKGNEQNDMFGYNRAEAAQELLVSMAAHFPGQGVDLLNSRLIEKIVEVAWSMSEYMSMQAPSRDPFTPGPREHLTRMMEVVAVVRQGDYRFLPLLLSKLSDVIPRLVNPMLQNAPENSNMANIDIFDGFGSTGLAQPPMQMSIDTDYDRKFSVSDYDQKFSMSDMGANDEPTPSAAGSSGSGSGSVPPASATEISSPFVASPGLMSPGIDFSHNMNDFNQLGDMVMTPISQGHSMNQSSSISPPQPQQHQHQHQHQHQQHTMQGLQGHNMNAQHLHSMNHNGLGQQPSNMGGINPQSLQGHQSLNTGSLNTPHPFAGLARQPPQRATSFAMSSQTPVPRTIGDFHALQRANAETVSTMASLQGMAGLNAEMDFGALR